jgi:hypothetical protein
MGVLAALQANLTEFPESGETAARALRHQLRLFCNIVWSSSISREIVSLSAGRVFARAFKLTIVCWSRSDLRADSQGGVNIASLG